MSQEFVVVIEDEEDIREVIEYNLLKEQFKVMSASNGRTGLNLVLNKTPDLVILDLMLPEIDGLDVCRKIREQDATKTTPIIMLTAKGEESDIILGLGLGADDYIVKPFSPKELIARVRAILRRYVNKYNNTNNKILYFGTFNIDPIAYEAQIDGKIVNLTLTEFNLLLCMASNQGRVFSREQLLQYVNDDNTIIIDRNIDVHILHMRKKLNEYRNVIETVRGIGYRFKYNP